MIKKLLRWLGCRTGVACDFEEVQVSFDDMPGWSFPGIKCRTCGDIHHL